MTDRPDTRHDEDFDVVEKLLRELSLQDTELVPPPEDLWDSIASEVGQAPTAPNVVSLASRRRFSPRAAMLSAAAAILLLIGAVAVVAQRGDDSEVVADAELSYDPVNFDGLGANAEAHVVLVNKNGTYRVEIDRSNLPDVAGEAADLEVWLIEPDAAGQPAQLVSLGRIDPKNPAALDVPAAYDPNVFSVVDISVEPRDGDANHSGRSILRGALSAT